MPYWRTYYHINWAVKGREPLISSAIETLMFPALAGKARELGGMLFAANGTADHVHVATVIPPRISVAEFVRHLKGLSSHLVRQEFDPAFNWQSGYGVVTFGERHLNAVVRYVRDQKAHHANGTTRNTLEAICSDDDGPAPPLGW